MYTFDDLKQILEKLRDKENGCPWDSVQTHESMKKYLVEECGEVLEAIDNQDTENLCEELGDVLLQVLMHSQIAEETGEFTLEDVIDTVSRKMIRRHPHVFGDVVADTPEECLRLWEQVKAEEKAQKNKKRQGFTKIGDSEV